MQFLHMEDLEVRKPFYPLASVRQFNAVIEL